MPLNETPPPKRDNLKVVIVDDNNSSYSTMHFYLNGEDIGFGEFGGEPEDNSRHRDYYWVYEVVTTLAKKLGSNVETVLEEEQDE